MNDKIKTLFERLKKEHQKSNETKKYPLIIRYFLLQAYMNVPRFFKRAALKDPFIRKHKTTLDKLYNFQLYFGLLFTLALLAFVLWIIYLR